MRYQGWASRVIFPELAADLGYLAPVSLKWVGNTISGPQDIQAAVTGDTDFGGAFNSAIERLVAAGAPIKAVIGNSGTDKDTWPGLYVLAGGAIKGPRDLIGKKIAVNTLGAHDEFMIDVFLQRYGLSPAEIKQVTLVPMPPASAEHVLRLKQVDAAILSDFYRDKAMATGGLDLLLTDYELFGALTTGSYVLTKRFIAENPNTTRKFVEATARAIEWARTQPRAAVIARFQDIIKKRGQVLGHRVEHGAVGGVAGGDFQRHDLAFVVDHEVQLEAVEPAHAGLAACGEALEHLMAVNAAIVADGELG